MEDGSFALIRGSEESLGIRMGHPHVRTDATRSSDAEAIHPFGCRSSNALEDQIGRAAHQAGLALLTEGQREYVDREGLCVCPIRRHFAEATLVDIARLTYRPRTSVTAQWWEEYNMNGTECLERYEAILEGATSRLLKVAQ